MKAFDNFTNSLTNIGFWSPACVQHGFIEAAAGFMSTAYRIPTTTGISMSDAIYQFMNNVSAKSANRHIDSVSWPLNTGCSSHSQSTNLKKRWFMSYE